MARIRRLFQFFSHPVNLISILATLAVWSFWTRWMHPWLLILGVACEIAYLIVRSATFHEVELYISHHERDLEFAYELSNLISKACVIPQLKVKRASFITDNNFYRDLATKPSKDIVDSVAYIGIRTLNSIDSADLDFESGARWGCRKHCANLFACGASHDRSEGPIASLESIDSSEMGQIFRLIHEISESLHRKPLPLKDYAEDVANLMELSKKTVKLHIHTSKPEAATY